MRLCKKGREKEKGIHIFTMMEWISPMGVPSHTFEIIEGSACFVFPLLGDVYC